MSSSALTSQGVTIARLDTTVSPNAYSTINEVSEINGPDGAASEIDVTDLNSSAKEFKMGLADEGNVTFTINYLPSDAVHAALLSDRDSQTLRTFRITLTSSPQETWTFTAYVTAAPLTNAVDGVTQMSITLKVSGIVTRA